MFGTLALSAALSFAPAQAGSVNISNTRLTHRDYGPTRADAKFLPGDVVFLSFDIDGLKMNDEGKISYTMGMEVLDKIGKAIFTSPATKYEAVLPLGGTKLPANVFVTTQDLPPGPYVCKVNITDATASAVTRTIEQKFDVLPASFGMVGLYVSYDGKAEMPCGMSGIVGQTVYVNFGMVGFGRDAGKKPDAAVEFRVLDESGKPTVAKPTIIALPRDNPPPDNTPLVPFWIPLPLNREGNFTIEIKAADKVLNKTASLTFPFKVYPASK